MIPQPIHLVRSNFGVVVSNTEHSSHTFCGQSFALRLCAAAAGLMLAVSTFAQTSARVPVDVASALNALPQLDAVHTARDGVPTFLRGNLARAPQLDVKDLAGTQRVMQSRLAPALTALRVQAADMQLRKISVDEHGTQVLRYNQTFNGLEVIGGDMVVQVDGKGKVFLINATPRGEIPVSSRRDIGETAAHTVAVTDRRYAGMVTKPARKVYFVSPEDGRVALAYEIVVTGVRGEEPVRDKVYINIETGAVLGVRPQIHFAENRKVYSANQGMSLPGTIKRIEGGITSTDADVNAAFASTGATYEAYKKFWNRDSYDNAGATIVSSVHYRTNFCQAYWDSVQMVFGDGNSSIGCKPLARGVDVAAHELTHAVTQFESGLAYYGESGGLNEAMSDIFGAFTEAFVLGGRTGTLVVNADTWAVGEAVMTPALRSMNDPAADGQSLDFYTGPVSNVDVHHRSGIPNLAFYLLSEGGKHPRRKSTIDVLGIGMNKAIRIFYEANVNLLTSNATYLSAANATVQAAVNLGYSTSEQASVADAWRAVGVSDVAGPTNCPGCPRSAGDEVKLDRSVAVLGLNGAAGSQKFFKLDVPPGQTTLVFKTAGGSGDADLHVRLNGRPTSSSYLCRPYSVGNEEVCAIAAPEAGTYHVMLSGYAAYSGVTLEGGYSAGVTGKSSLLSNNVPVKGIEGKAAATAYYGSQYWMINVPAGKTLTVSTSGTVGDADMYVQAGSQPWTSDYACRPLGQGNERCTLTVPKTGDYYIMLRGKTDYSGLTLKASY